MKVLWEKRKTVESVNRVGSLTQKNGTDPYGLISQVDALVRLSFSYQ